MNYFRYKSNNEDLGYTPVENIFINHYMPSAPGEYVKVYLLGLKYCFSQSNNSLSTDIIAKSLNISEEEVGNAFKYWEEQGIIKRYPCNLESRNEEFVIEFLNIKEIVLNIKGRQPSVGKYSPDRIINARRDSKIKDMFDYITKISGREPSQSEIFTFLDWIDDYKLAPEVVTLIVEDCFSRGKKDLPYLKQVAKNWFDAGVDTLDKANEYISLHKEKWQKYSKVLNFLRLGRQPTLLEEEMLQKWFYTYQFSDEIVLKACELTAKTLKPSFSYIDKILTEWYEKNFKTIAEIEQHINKSSKHSEKTTDRNQKQSFNNFVNRTYDTKMLKERLLKKSRGELSE